MLVCFRPEAVAQCIVDLIKDETDVGQVVRVTHDEGVEFLNYNDVSVNFILNSLKRKICLDTLEDSGYDELRCFSMKLVYALKTTFFFNPLKIVLNSVLISKLLLTKFQEHPTAIFGKISVRKTI